jgi:thiol:disulfide interchange protein
VSGCRVNALPALPIPYWMLRPLAVLAVLAIAAFATRGKWGGRVVTLEAALKDAHKLESPLVIEFSMTGCQACQQFESTILTRPDVKKALEQVYFVRYNVTEDAAGLDAAERLKVGAFPTVVVVGDNGRERFRMEGFPAGPPGAAYFTAFLGKAVTGR